MADVGGQGTRLLRSEGGFGRPPRAAPRPGQIVPITTLRGGLDAAVPRMLGALRAHHRVRRRVMSFKAAGVRRGQKRGFTMSGSVCTPTQEVRLDTAMKVVFRETTNPRGGARRLTSKPPRRVIPRAELDGIAPSTRPSLPPAVGASLRGKRPRTGSRSARRRMGTDAPYRAFRSATSARRQGALMVAPSGTPAAHRRQVRHATRDDDESTPRRGVCQYIRARICGRSPSGERISMRRGRLKTG